MVLQICNFFFKNTPYRNGYSAFFSTICKKNLDSESSDTYLTPAYPKVVPYYFVLLSNLHPKSADFPKKC